MFNYYTIKNVGPQKDQINNLVFVAYNCLLMLDKRMMIKRKPRLWHMSYTFFLFMPPLDTFMTTNFDTRKLKPVYNVNSLILCDVLVHCM